ncbi:ADP-ribosylglycohydrolase family protein [Streptosporangium sp. CA-135522]|uniref:ADP-ribosylglycohydrolase family protein n=1 Tax=Streptosporangium sp. CA-135522 TaxID=3240072 RepID=UPI003D94AB51
MLPYGSRVRGCLLGGAVGDALGNPVEFMTLAQIRAEFGPAGLTTMVETVVTDDTQMTLFTAEGLIRSRLHGGGVLESLHEAYLRWLDTQNRATPAAPDDRLRTGWLRRQPWLYARRAPGNACLSGLRSGILPPPPEFPPGHGPVNPDSKGCGTVMRSAPFGLVPGQAGSARAAARITHGHPTAAVASGALADLIEGLVRGRSLFEAVAETVTHGETAEAVEAARDLAAKGGPTAQKVESLGQGWVAEEALAIALYCALVEPDPRRALLLSVNHSGDSDSTGAICGNILGAWHGEAALPADWTSVVEGRDTILRVADDFVAAYDLTSRYPSA